MPGGDGKGGWRREGWPEPRTTGWHTDAVQATSSGFSFPPDEGDRGWESTEGGGGGGWKAGRERTTECEGRASCFRWGMSQFSLSEKDGCIAGRGTAAIVATSRLSCSRGSNARNIPRSGNTRMCAKHRRVAFTRRSGLRSGQWLKEFTLTFTWKNLF